MDISKTRENKNFGKSRLSQGLNLIFTLKHQNNVKRDGPGCKICQKVWSFQIIHKNNNGHCCCRLFQKARAIYNAIFFIYTCKLAQLHETFTFNFFFIEKIIWIKFVVAFCLVLLVSEFSCYLILHRYIYQHNKEMEQNSIITENTFKNRLYKIYKLRNI